MNVFVYGTLKRGFRNDWAMRGCKQVTSKAELPSAWLYNVGPYPALKHDISNQTPSAFVVGEVYEVNNDQLQRLDAFEGVPHMYNRIKTMCSNGEPELDDEELEVYVYVWNQPFDKLELIESGEWTEGQPEEDDGDYD